MHRRTFSLGMGALLAGPALGTRTRANTADLADALPHGTIRALRLRFANGDFQTFDGFELANGHRALGLRWTSGAPVFNEDRINLSGTGLGGLFRTPFRVRWQSSQPIGTVERIGSRLVARVNSPAMYAGFQVTVGAGDFSWDLRGSLSDMAATAGRGAPVGAIRVEDNERLLVSISGQPAF